MKKVLGKKGMNESGEIDLRVEIRLGVRVTKFNKSRVTSWVEAQGYSSSALPSPSVNLIMDKRIPTPPNVLNPQSTPRRVLDITTDAKLQSTPSNRGSASASEYLSGVLYDLIFDYKVCLQKRLIIYSVDDVSPSILADIQDHATCTVETLLNGLLSLCLPEEYKHNAPADLLNQCLNAVLPICNAQDHQIKTKGKQKRTDEEALADSLGLRTYLIE
jgi:hypothetical protein